MWFPRPLYEALPYVYLAAGAVALAAAFMVDDAPHGWLLLLGGGCLTLGLVLWMRRRDYRASQDEYDTHSLDR
jgi:hypothetical protein